MQKLLSVVFALVAVAVSAPTPGYLHGAILPVATSHSSRIDIHSKPIVTYAAPAVVHAPLIAAPIVKTIVAAPYGIGIGHGYGGYGHSYGGYGHSYGGYGLGYGGIGHLGLGHGGYLGGHYL